VWPFLLPFIFLTGFAAWFDFAVAAWLLGFVSVFIAFFFRDPNRAPGGAADDVVAPADGRLVGIERATFPDDPDTECLKISIFLSVLDVHVNKMPLAGKVVSVERTPGKFLNAMNALSAEENERNDIMVETAAGKMLVRQIAGLIARRIVCYVKPGDELVRGERIGLIRFGSRTEVYLPAEYEACIADKSYVRGGKTVLARLPK
jgi:phosphatidylserine decarboxylase